jgi:20S proteasome alpha/beta subunit
MIIQTPELIIYKRIDAEKRIDNYLLLLVVFKNGLVFGIKFNERQNEERQNKLCQWLMEINSTVITACIGDFHDFETCTQILTDFCRKTDNTLGKHYITGKGIEKFLANMLREGFSENVSVLAVNFLVADCQNQKEPALWFIDFDGDTKPLKNFAVAGGTEYEEPLTEEEFKKLTEEQKDEFEQRKLKIIKNGAPKDASFTPSRLRYPKKEAIAYLEKNWKPNMKKEGAIELVKSTLFKFNPESKDRTIEIVIVEKKGSEAQYFTKK